MKTKEPQSLDELRSEGRARQQRAADDLERRRKFFLIEAFIGVSVLVAIELCIMAMSGELAILAAVLGGPGLLTVFCVVSIGYLFGLLCIRQRWSGVVGILIHGMALGITSILLGYFHPIWWVIWTIWGWLIAKAISSARESHLNSF